MNGVPFWVQLVIGILGGGALGGITGAIASIFTSRLRIRELEVAFNQKQEENYRANIKQHIETLYIPINIGVSKLNNQYNKYIWSSLSDRQQAETAFRLECKQFVTQMLDIYECGKDVYLTKELDEQLRFFTFFIKSSLDYDISNQNDYGYIGGRHVESAALLSENFKWALAEETQKIKDIIRKASLFN